MEMFNFLRYSCVTLGCLVALSHCNVGNAQSAGTLFSFQEITTLETIAGDYPALPIRFADLNAIALVDTGLPAATMLDSSLERQLADQSLLLGEVNSPRRILTLEGATMPREIRLPWILTTSTVMLPSMTNLSPTLRLRTSILILP